MMGLGDRMLYWLENNRLEPYEAGGSVHRRLSETLYKQALQASDIMSQPVRSIEAFQSLQQAHELMLQLGIAHLAVTDSGEFSGLLSDRDILYAEDKSDFVGLHMSGQLVLASPTEKIAKIASIMVEHHIHCVPILDQDFFLVGILTTSDILGCMTHQAPLDVWF